jgi:23S rRNA G2445 N2-methylase RlmL
MLARCVRGIEWICAAELSNAFGADIQRVEHRLVEFVAPMDPALLRAGTVDDLFLLAVRFHGLDHRRETLNALRRQTSGLEVAPLLEMITSLRRVPPRSPFEVVASFLGRRNYTRYDVEGVVGTGLEMATGSRFLPGPMTDETHPDLSWRVHLFDGGGVLALRLGAAPLHRRRYRMHSVRGSLHPPLAYAACMLAGPKPGSGVLDPFCGSGTMLLEARRVQPDSFLIGSDVEISAVRTARANAGIQYPAGWFVGDAGRMALAAETVDTVLTNPPWRRQVERQGALAPGLENFWSELARVTTATGRMAVVLQGLEEEVPAIRAAGFAPLILQRVAVSGAWSTLGLLVKEHRCGVEQDRLQAMDLRPPQDAGAQVQVGRHSTTK